MKDARIVEEADHRQIWHAPQTDYTRRLIAAANGGDAASRQRANHAARTLTTFLEHQS
ncbi:hypothetical protein D3C86_2154710 [compost metagenome]